LAAFWYENRDAASYVAAREVPFGVREIVTEFRGFTF
ncbi:phage gp6-like head-tail connector protein, partial [Thioclava sp. BHET1]